MKTFLLAALGFALLAGSAAAGPRFGVSVNFGGGYCAPRYAPPVCYAPRVVYAPRVYYRAAPVCYVPAPVVYAPRYTRVYRAPAVRAVAYRW